MTTRSKQKITSILAVVSIIALLLLLVFLWSAVRNGVFSNSNEFSPAYRSYRFQPINLSDASANDSATTVRINSTETTTIDHRTHHPHGHHSHHHHHQHESLSEINSTESTLSTPPPSQQHADNHHNHNQSTSERADAAAAKDAEASMDVDQLVKPSKIHVQPLHPVDLLYESTKYDPSADTGGKVPEHRITGQYRNRTSLIWDPHPQYLIDAFGLHLHLILYEDSNFIPRHIKITHVWQNEMQRKPEDHKDHEQLRGCFYRGRIRTDDRSAVAVSLCDGMRGHIYTSSGSFFIEPVEVYTVDNQNILHKISREKMPMDKVHFDKNHSNEAIDEEMEENEEIDNITAEDVDLELEEDNATEKDLNETSAMNKTQCSADNKNCSNEESITEDPLIFASEEVGTTTLPSSTPVQSDLDNMEDFTMENEFSDDEAGFTTAANIEETTTKRSARRKRHINSYNNYAGGNSVDNNAYTMEVMVAVDRKMQEYHGQNINAYVLTLMSIVSSIYADASIGNSINVAVVHILLLKDDLNVEYNYAGVSASQMLSRFCKFVQHHPFHHDTALLLTREQICRNANQKKCDTLGLAELGTMCRPSSCAIVQDNGLSAAFTIAHELGHVLSMPHDDDAKCAKFRNEDGSNSQQIMSRMLDHNTHPWSWSACSRHYVTEYLEHNRGFCMLNKPHHDMIETSNQLLAGEKFPANQQCELVFGPNSKVCPFTVTVSIFGQQIDQPPCVRLWCGSESEGCRTQHMPWADGTECGTGHWCQHGKCVPRNRMALTKIDGGWGEWKPFDQCSRACGGGVQSSTRDCNNPSPANGGKYCVGTRIKYRSCNIQDCPPDAPDFREQQCAEMNNNNFGIPGLDANVRWVPKYGQSPHDECKLYCRVEKSNNYFLLNDKVKDGTSCSHDSFNKCVNGICRPAGCNNQLDSDAKLDKCGVCNGNNDTCMDIVGIFRPEQIEKAKEYSKTPYYYHVTVIPKGASNIEILQPGYSDDLNYIALMDDQGEYILNGYNVITQYPRIFPYGGVTFDYTGTNSTLERVNTTFAKRLKRDLTVEILSRSEQYHTNELIRFGFTMDLNETRNTHINFYPYNQNQYPNTQGSRHHYAPPASVQYKWEMSEWSECNSICDGEQFRTATCMKIDTGRHVADTNCRDAKPPDEYQNCNSGCTVDWEIQRSKCSVECGDGIQELTYSCIQTYSSSNHRKVVDDSYCPTSQRSKQFEKCKGTCASAVWTYEEYGPCSRICNGGVQTRTAYCTSHYRGSIIDDNYCAHLTKEDLERSCNTHECPKWQYGDESACSVTCGNGYKTRSAICVQNNSKIDAKHCDSQSKPKDLYNKCQMDPCYRKSHTPNPVLYANEIAPRVIDSYNTYGSKYGGTSKPGVTYRRPWLNALSTTTTTTTRKPITTTTVAPTTAPSYVHPQQRQSHRFIWRTSRWNPCSATCGGGVRMRSVRCVNDVNNQIVDDRYCVDEKPVNITNCAQHKCPKWRTGDWGQCNLDTCKRHRQVVCQDDRYQNNITNCPLNTRPTSVDECCQFKWRNLWTPCSAECGTGTRSRQRACMRLFPRPRDDQRPRKKGQPVDAKYCKQMKQPPFIPKSKVCRKQTCALPKWEVMGPWSRCSVGCGKGFSTREVKCTMNGKAVNEILCPNDKKPVVSRHCETASSCLWKTGPWKPCSCTGYTKRRVQCFDTKLNRQSNNCLESSKPEQKKRCDQPATCSCKGLQQLKRIYTDGDYELTVRGRKAQIYCHRMNTSAPEEFITLRNYQENYSSYYDRRSRRKDDCPQNEADQFHDTSLPSGVTYFSRVRIDLHSLQVKIDDFTFAYTSGRRQQRFATAGDCFSASQRCARGAFSINFETTKFRIRPRTRWDTRGNNVVQHFHGFEAPYQKMASSCGGYCGECFPSRETSLHLEVI